MRSFTRNRWSFAIDRHVDFDNWRRLIDYNLRMILVRIALEQGVR
jgi:hypothetical protein